MSNEYATQETGGTLTGLPGWPWPGAETWLRRFFSRATGQESTWPNAIAPNAWSGELA